MKYLIALLILLPFSVFADHDFFNIGYIGGVKSDHETQTGNDIEDPIVEGDHGVSIGFEDLYTPFKYLNFSQEFLLSAAKIKTRTYTEDGSSFDRDRAFMYSFEYRFDAISFFDWVSAFTFSSPPESLDYIIGIGPLAGIYYVDMNRSVDYGNTFWGLHMRGGLHFLKSNFIKRLFVDVAFKSYKEMKPYDGNNIQMFVGTFGMSF